MFENGFAPARNAAWTHSREPGAELCEALRLFLSPELETSFMFTALSGRTRICASVLYSASLAKLIVGTISCPFQLVASPLGPSSGASWVFHVPTSRKQGICLSS